MTEVMLTSGQGFEGYEIVEYLGFVNVQSVLSSNFFKGFAAGVSEMSDSESEKLTGKLEQVNETALKRLQTIAKKKESGCGNWRGTELYTVCKLFRRNDRFWYSCSPEEEARGESSYRKISVCQQLL